VLQEGLGKSLRKTEFVDFVHRPEVYITGMHNVSETGFFSVFK
jgi:hypothetical protein